MSPDDEFNKPEDVERRREPRGVFEGLHIALTAPRPGEYDAVEASRRGFFIPVDDPETFMLGEVHEARITLRGKQSTCRLEVFRKEIQPRRGVALRIIAIDPNNEEQLRGMLGAAGF